MPITPLSNVLGSIPGAPPLDPLEVDIAAPDAVTVEDGARSTELPDGSVIIELEPRNTRKADKFNSNLAEVMSDLELAKIGSDLIEGIRRDDDSRADHLAMIAEGMKLLGLVIESNASAAGDSSAPLEGMSTARHPLLLEACQLFQANAMGELLPAAGPVKVRDDRPQKPSQDGMMGHNGGPPLNGPSPFAAPAAGMAPQGAPAGSMPPSAPAPGPAAPLSPPPPGAPPVGAGAMPQPAPVPPPVPPVAEEPRDEIAEAFEKDFNHYLTAVAKEYVPDTDQMLFKVGFSGLGVKKVYNCPLRRRPVSESIDIEDFIVSNALTDLSNAGRITHRIKMRPSVLKRMQILGVYRDVALGDPTPATDVNAVDQAKAEIAGTEVSAPDPRDTDYELYECYCELDLDEFAPQKFKGKGLPLPYRVTLEKESHKVLEIRRNWREDDEECLAREFFVDFPYMRAFGFYCIGLLHLLGNTTKALTALWREFIDAGMFANFPGFLYLKGAGRQNTNQFRVAPGSGVGLDSSVQDIRQSVMPLPYKPPDAGFVQFVGHIEELGQRLGGTSNTAVAEGRADAPVGTTLALIEQASKPVGAVNKRLHAAQAREFALLKDRFRDDPEAFWRFNRRPALAWRKEQFLKALEDYDLVPVSDPNNPTRMHRAAKASWLQQVATAAPGLLDPKKVFLRAAQEMEIDDVEDLLAPPLPPQAPPVDPAKMADVQHKNAKLQADAAAKAQDAELDLVKTRMEVEDRAADRANKERVALIEQETERLRLASTFAIHSDKINSAREAMQFKALSDHVGKAAQQQHEIRMAQGGEVDEE